MLRGRLEAAADAHGAAPRWPACGSRPGRATRARRRRSWRTRATAWLLALGALTSACSGPVASLYPPRGDEVARQVWVVRHDWHTGVVVRREDVPADVWPERDEFSGAVYLEVGWGDRDFYQAPQGTLWMGLKAAFWANDSVLHVAAFSTPPAVYFAGSEVAEIPSPRGASTPSRRSLPTPMPAPARAARFRWGRVGTGTAASTSAGSATCSPAATCGRPVRFVPPGSPSRPSGRSRPPTSCLRLSPASGQPGAGDRRASNSARQTASPFALAAERR